MYKFYFKKTTLLITLKDEKELTKRLIKYLNNQSLKINILIADGSINKQQKLFSFYCFSGFLFSEIMQIDGRMTQHGRQT